MKFVKKIVNNFYLIILKFSVIKKYYLWKYSKSQLGTSGWLIYNEIKYGGISTNVKRNKVSVLDPRSKKQISKGGMIGGDRMLYHGYANKYSDYLLPYIKNEKSIVLVEIGILRGVGIAIWCDLFKKGRILGFDIDLNHIKKNKDNLINLGAFNKNKPELHEFDQFKDNNNYVAEILNGDTIDICIDDGYHSNESIIKTMKSIVPHLSEKFIYIIEDNNKVYDQIYSIFPKYKIDVEGELTIVTNNN